MKSPQIIRLQRTNSIGDTVAATVIADELVRMGYTVQFHAHPNCHPALRLHPKLKLFSPNGAPTINLDGAYENHPARNSTHIFEMYRQRANANLSKAGVQIQPMCNWAPRLESSLFPLELKCMPEPPRIAIVPRSNAWPNRTVDDAIWREAAKAIPGTKLWLGNHAPAPEGIYDCKCRSIESVVRWINLAQLVVSVDTGPMHIAAAFRKPLVVIRQAIDPALRLPRQRDWTTVGPLLECLNCHKEKCPIDAVSPPCQKVLPEAIAAAVNAALDRLPGSGRVSAIIAVYKPSESKLNRCLDAILPQVDEVVICGDLDTPWPISGILSNEKIRCVRMPDHKTGYGKKSTYGARHANAEFLLQLNDDVYLNPDVVEKLMQEMKPDVGVVTHTLRHLDGKIQYAGKHRDRGSFIFGHTDFRGDKCRYTSPIEQESACGASMLVRRSAFFESDAFDERYWLYGDDDDLVLKIRKLGFKSIFTPFCEGIHEEHQSVNITPGWQNAMRESNRKFAAKWAWYFQKNPDPSKIGSFQ